MNGWSRPMQIRGASGNSSLAFGCLFSQRPLFWPKTHALILLVEPAGPQPSYSATGLSLGANAEQGLQSQPAWGLRKFLLPPGVGKPTPSLAQQPSKLGSHLYCTSFTQDPVTERRVHGELSAPRSWRQGRGRTMRKDCTCAGVVRTTSLGSPANPSNSIKFRTPFPISLRAPFLRGYRKSSCLIWWIEWFVVHSHLYFGAWVPSVTPGLGIWTPLYLQPVSLYVNCTYENIKIQLN